MPLTVLELGDNYAAGYAGKLFRHAGARVIRVDVPGSNATATPEDEARAIDLYLHDGKQRLALDKGLASARGLLEELASEADIIVADLAPADLDRLDWDTLGGSRTTARTAITSFGLDGPYRDWRATSSVLLAMGGQTYIIGDPDRAPLTIPGRYVEYQAGQFAFTASLAVHRAKPTATRHIDVSLLETVLSLSQYTMVMWTFGEQIRTRHGNDFATLHPLSMYRCADGWYTLNVTPPFWGAFLKMIDRPDLAEDERFASLRARLDHRREMDAIIDERLGDKTRDELMHMGQRTFRVPTGKLMSHRELLDDEHLNARGFWQPLGDHPEIRTAAPAFRYIEGGT